MTKKTKMFTDKDGNEIPSGYIHKIDKDKHYSAQKLAKKAIELSTRLFDFKEDLFRICDELYERALAEQRITLRAKSKGSYTISTIDKKIKVEVVVSEFTGFGDDISIAHELIKEYLQEKTKGVDTEIIQIVNAAFESSGGNLDVKRILGLKKFNINHPKWKQAMEVIDRCYEVRNTKRYARIWIMDEAGSYQAVKLDFASL